MTRSNLKNSKRREAKVKLTLSTLNNDIVVLLSRMLHNRDLLSIMASCQNLFRLGLPILLERELYIRARSLQSFHKFLDFASPSSFSALRDIKFFDEDFSPAQLRIVSAILNQATELKILGITTELLVRDDTLALAVATLTRLDHLRLVGDSFIAQPLAVMTLLRSPLRRVSIACCRPWSDINSQNDDTTQIAGSDNDTDPVDLMPILAKFSTSLEHVDLCDVSFLDSTISCPRVTRLDLSPCGGPWLSALVPAFPNLNVLTADMETFYATNPKDDETLVESYNDNIAFQQQHGSWCHLKSICTELSTLYALGLQCKVDSLVINSAIRVRLSDDFDHINTLHQLLSPLQLKHLRLEDICDLTSDGMASLLSIGLQTLQRLDIYTKVSVLDKDSYQIELVSNDTSGNLWLGLIRCTYHCRMQ